MNRKTMVITIGIVLAFCAGIYFWAEQQKRAFDVSLPKVPAVEEQAGGHWHGDEWHAEAHAEAAPPPLPDSVIPDELPEHLKLPQEWIDGRYYGWEDGLPDTHPCPLTDQEPDFFLNSVHEILTVYNPNRPMTEVWPQFIEIQKAHRAHAERELGFTPLGGLGCGRIDWFYELLWAAPEAMKIILMDLQEEPDPFKINFFANVLATSLGENDPDWNFHVLPDGREFRLKDGHRYEFKQTFPHGSTTQGLNLSTVGNIEPPLIVIDLDNTSDEELKELGGWNYNINPYTNQPIDYEPYPIKWKGWVKKGVQ